MLGSQAINLTGSIAGLDIGVPEVFRFGFAHFPTAVATTDSWTFHDGAEIIFLLEGEACWELEGEFLVPLYGGQSALFTRKLRHRITNGIYPPSSTFWIVLRGPECSFDPALLTPESCRKFQSDLGQRGLTRKVTAKCLESICEMTRLMKDKKLYTGSEILVAEMRAHLHLVLIETWKAHHYRQPRKGDSEIVERALEAIHETGGTGISISDLAQEMGCSRGHLYNQFRSIVGMPPSDYAQRLRIKESCRLLSSDTASITEIAHDNGFSSSQHFSRVFKRYLGVTPSGYRSQVQKIGSTQ